MGNKRITEKDFWICTEGAMPAQLQGTRELQRKESGEVYITVADKSTSSFIDFGCKKYMWLMGLVAAVAIVGLALVGVLTVATGGAALIALGMVAGAAGAAIGGVIGGLLCGQKMAGGRNWIEIPKAHKTVFQGANQVTGDFSMVCKAGGKIEFNPQIKSWSQAIALGTSTYIKEIMTSAMNGAMVGMGGAAFSGGLAAFAGGGLRGLGQAALQFAKGAPKLIGTNLFEGMFMDLGFKAIDGSTAVLDSYGANGQAGAGDFVGGVIESATGDLKSLKSIVTTGGSFEDWQAAIMLFAPGGKGETHSGGDTSTNHQSNTSYEHHSNTPENHGGHNVGEGGDAYHSNNEGDGGDNSNNSKPNKPGPAEKPKPKNKKGESFEDGISNKAKGKIGEKAVIDKLKTDGFTEVLQIQNNSGHGVDIIARNPETGNVKVIEVKTNTSKLSDAQKEGGEKFTNSRLKRAQGEEGHWNVPPNDSELPKNAKKAEKWIDNADNVDYEVHRVEVNNSTGETGKPKVTKW